MALERISSRAVAAGLSARPDEMEHRAVESVGSRAGDLPHRAPETGRLRFLCAVSRGIGERGRERRRMCPRTSVLLCIAP